MKVSGPSGWRGVMNRRPQPSEFGLSPLADNVDSLTLRPNEHVRSSRNGRGVGGAMRFLEDHDLRRHSRAGSTFHSRPISFCGRRAALSIYCAFLVTALLVLHVHLRFSIHDMQMQEHLLQTVQRHLDRRISSLDRGVAHNMGDLGRLRDYAVNNLQMVPNERGMDLAIAPDIAQKYSPESIAETRKKAEQAVADADSEDSPRNPFKRLADFALAFAPEQR